MEGEPVCLKVLRMFVENDEATRNNIVSVRLFQHRLYLYGPLFTPYSRNFGMRPCFGDS
jgi:hypothetical protein